MSGQNIFNSIQMQRPKRNTFDLTHDIKTSFNISELIPVMCMEAIPGDSFKIGCQTLLRFQPLIAPVMHRIDISIHYFFVPYRLLWKNWEYYITGQNDPSTALPPVFPFINVANTTTATQVGPNVSGSLMDYLGIPLTAGTTAPEKINCLPFYAYQKIYNDYYRDQNLDLDLFKDNTLPPAIDGNNYNSGVPIQTLYLGLQLRNRAWEHDYFTAALPFAQKGNPVSLPLGDVVLKPYGTGTGQTTAPGKFKSALTGHPDDAWTSLAAANAAGEINLISGASKLGVYDPQGTLSVGATTINDLRTAFKLQEWLERNARGGTRYIEHILAHFGIQSSDKRLQRPEYICGMKQPVQISEIVNTGGDGATLPQGNMSGHGLSAAAGRIGSYFVEEHGLIMGIMSVMPKTAYQQGIPKIFTKTNSYLDYAFPEFAHLGEQPVLNKEIYAYQTAPANDATFGYVPRYAEYKYEPNRVSGDFRTTLAFWHLGRIFASAPALNATFVRAISDTSMNRVFAVTSPVTQKLMCHVLNTVKVSRLLPRFGTPLSLGGTD